MEQLGLSVDISGDGNRVVIGQNDRRVEEHPFVRVYDWTGSQWVQLGSDLLGDGPEDGFGSSVSISDDGSRIAVGIPQFEELTNKLHARVFHYNNGTWEKLGGDILITGTWAGLSVDLNRNGKRLLVGSSKSQSKIHIFDESNENWNRVDYGLFSREGTEFLGREVSFSQDGRRLAVSDYLFDNSYLNAGEVRVFEMPNMIGEIYNDDDLNCEWLEDETPLSQRSVLINPGNQIVQTNQTGTWQFIAPFTGEYTIQYDTLGPWSTACSSYAIVEVSHLDSIAVAKPFGLKLDLPCSDPSINIHMPLMRPCRENQVVFVEICNSINASAPLPASEVIVTLDSNQTIDTANISYEILEQNKIRFSTIHLEPDTCQKLKIFTDLSCNIIPGQSICMSARLDAINSCDIFHDSHMAAQNNCLLPYDNSILSMSMICEGDSIKIDVINNGDTILGDMQCPSQLRIFQDDVFVAQDSIRIPGQSSKTITLFATGETIRVECDQHPFYPGERTLIQLLELCGDNANWTPDQYNLFDLGDRSPLIDVFCGPATASYDPNDKRGVPYGQGAHNFIPHSQQIEYIIRFQNTGNDTAFDIRIIDTLDFNLDFLTFKAGISSHEYDLEIKQLENQFILIWNFNQIYLPDSTTNEQKSHGFLKYSIQPRFGIDDFTIIYNNADIYFDFNDPIRTNTTVHTVRDLTDIYSTTSFLQPKSSQDKLRIYLVPNPSQGEFCIEHNSLNAMEGLRIFNMQGQLILENQVYFGNRYCLSLSLDRGLYLLQLNTKAGKSYIEKFIISN